MISSQEIHFFKKKGYLIVSNMLNKDEVAFYSKLYNNFLNNTIDASRFRSDLSGLKTQPEKEKITQIMVPSKLLPSLSSEALHIKTHQIAKELLGDDMALDFDMLINKAPHTNKITPWHQDCAYWIKMPDKRALSCWVAIDNAYKENGCMWYVPESHLKPMLPHTSSIKGGALICEGNEADAVCIELEAGSCVIHDGGTLHYSRGNSTAVNRRAFITNYRPKKMIDLERSKGYDHTGERKVNNELV